MIRPSAGFCGAFFALDRKGSIAQTLHVRAMSERVCAALLVLSAVAACTPKKDDTAGSSAAVSDQTVDPTAGNGLVISQIYGGGGLSTSLWNRGYVELFNRTSAPISLKNVALHYAGPISEFGLAASMPSDAIVPPGGYYLVGFLGGQAGLDLQCDTNGLPVGVLPVNGKLALVRAIIEESGDAAAQKMGCGSMDAGTCVGNARVIDVVGYGVTTDHEGPSTASSPSTRTALFRKDAGCTDTGDNKADFDVAAPAPRTSRTAPHVCEATK
jgi:hypothetical protein